MIISKDISQGTLDVDTEKGTVWLNTSVCVLRIQGLKFVNEKEKFSMIDIRGNEAAMLEGDLVEDEFSKTLNDIICHVYMEFSKRNDGVSSDLLVPFIKQCVERYK